MRGRKPRIVSSGVYLLFRVRALRESSLLRRYQQLLPELKKGVTHPEVAKDEYMDRMTDVMAEKQEHPPHFPGLKNGLDSEGVRDGTKSDN